MKRSTRILLAIAVAAITFGTLQATVGPRYYGEWQGNNHHHCGWYDNDKNDKTNDEKTTE
jgi:hypothetical protein